MIDVVLIDQELLCSSNCAAAFALCSTGASPTFAEGRDLGICSPLPGALGAWSALVLLTECPPPSSNPCGQGKISSLSPPSSRPGSLGNLPSSAPSTSFSSFQEKAGRAAGWDSRQPWQTGCAQRGRGGTQNDPRRFLWAEMGLQGWWLDLLLLLELLLVAPGRRSMREAGQP